jgi:hypothetical protein
MLRSPVIWVPLVIIPILLFLMFSPVSWWI